MKWRSFPAFASLLCLIGFTAAPSLSSAEELVIEEIVVTGSRIARLSGMDTPTPLTAVTSEEIEASGAVNLGDFLNEMPALRSTFSLNNSSRFIGTSGLNLLDLRGLGTARTLVLVDGQRHVAGTNGSSAVDINTIPKHLVDRVEVITGGASAIYGADAVTGVVNFVMKDDFDGLIVDAQGSFPEQSGGERWDFGVTFGKNFSDDRGNFSLAWEHADNTQLSGNERDWVADEWSSYFNPADTGPDDGIADLLFQPQMFDNRISERGLIWGPHQVEEIFGLPGFFTPILGFASGPYSFGPNGELDPFDIGQTYTDPDGFAGNSGRNGDGYPFANQEMMFPDVKRDNLYGRVRYDFNDYFNLTAEGKYTKVKTKSYGQASFDFFTGLFIAPDNAFIQDDLRQLMNDEGSTGFYLNKFHEDMGNRGETNDRDTYRLVLALDGNFLGDTWTYNVSANYGHYQNDAEALNNRNNTKFYNAVDAVDDGNGNIVCRDPDARADGCIPWNVLGNGVGNPAALEYIMERGSTWEEEMSQQVYNAYIAGPVFELPAGPLDTVVGAEYRKEKSRVEYAEVIRTEDTFFNALSDTDADYDVSELFMEASVPVVTGVTGFDSFIIDGAVRFSDYSSIGNTTTWKLGFDWQVVEDVRLRLTASEAIRAPNIGELFDPRSQNFFSVDDPCSDSEVPLASDPALREANCVALGKPPGYESVNDNATIGGTSGGNPDLTEEEADTLTYGVVLTPRWVPNLSVSIDYWDIDFDQAIVPLGAQDILDRCVDSADINNQFCPLINRDPDFDLNADDGIAQQTLNIARLHAEGIDYEVNYNWDISELSNSNIGTLNFRLYGTHLLTLEQFDFQDDPSSRTDDRGVLGDPMQSWRFSTSWMWNSLSLTYQWRHIGKMRLIDNDESRERQDPYRTDNTDYHNLQARYLFENVGNGTVELYGGINNLSDQKPFFKGNVVGTGAGSGIYDVLGRSYYLGLKYQL